MDNEEKSRGANKKKHGWLTHWPEGLAKADGVKVQRLFLDLVSYALGILLTLVPFGMDAIVTGNFNSYALGTSLLVVALKSIEEFAKYFVDLAESIGEQSRPLRAPLELVGIAASLACSVVGMFFLFRAPTIEVHNASLCTVVRRGRSYDCWCSDCRRP